MVTKELATPVWGPIQLAKFINKSQSADTICQAAGIPRLYARTVGIAVDGRRQNLSEESLAANVARLKEYKSRLIVYPRQANRPKAGDTPKAEQEADFATTLKKSVPIINTDKTVQEISKSDMPAPVEGGAYKSLRLARTNKRMQGRREKRAAEKAEAAEKK